MNVTLKPFDFAQAVARAGLGTDGVPLANKAGRGAADAGFQKALTQALGAVSKSQNDAVRMQREVMPRQPDREPRADDGRDAEGADRLRGDAAGPQSPGSGVFRRSCQMQVQAPPWSSWAKRAILARPSAPPRAGARWVLDCGDHRCAVTPRKQRVPR